MKYKGILMGLAGLAVAVSLTACGRGYTEEQNAKRLEGIKALEASQYDKAIKSFDEALAEDSDQNKMTSFEVDVNLYKASALYLKGNAAGAKNLYGSIISSDSKNAMAYYMRGCLFIADEKYDAAKKDLSKAAENAGDDAGLLLRISEAMSSVGDDSKAVALLKDAAKNAKEDDHFTKGLAYARLGNSKKANAEIAALKKAQAEEDKAKSSDKNTDSAAPASTNTVQYETALIETELNIAIGAYKTVLSNEVYTGLDKKTDVPEHIEKQLRRDQIIALEYTGGVKEAKKLAEDYVKEYPDDIQMAQEYSRFLETR